MHRAGYIAVWGTMSGQATVVSAVCFVYLVCISEQNKLNQLKRPDKPDSRHAPMNRSSRLSGLFWLSCWLD
jgi:hypothetical protein